MDRPWNRHITKIIAADDAALAGGVGFGVVAGIIVKGNEVAAQELDGQVAENIANFSGIVGKTKFTQFDERTIFYMFFLNTRANEPTDGSHPTAGHFTSQLLIGQRAGANVIAGDLIPVPHVEAPYGIKEYSYAKPLVTEFIQERTGPVRVGVSQDGAYRRAGGLSVGIELQFSGYIIPSGYLWQHNRSIRSGHWPQQ